MSRAQGILEYVNTIDQMNVEEESAYTVDTNQAYHLGRQVGYRYMDRGATDPLPDSEKGTGTKPSGMMLDKDGDMDDITMDPNDLHQMGSRS